MTDQVYKETLKSAEDELEQLLSEEAKIEMRLVAIRHRAESLRRTVLSLGDLVGEAREPQIFGITDAIRKVMSERKEGSHVSAQMVRSILERDKFPLSEYKNAMAVIHTTLKRLVDQGELQPFEASNGKTYYKWIDRGITDEDIPF